MRKTRQVAIAFVAAAVLISIVALALREDRAAQAVSPPATRESANDASVSASESADTSSARVDLVEAATSIDTSEAPATSAWSSARITGLVVDATSGLPLAAQAGCGDREADTDPTRGRFTLDVPMTATRLLVTARGYRAHELSFELTEPALDIGTLELRSENVTVVRVVDEHGASVPHAELHGQMLEVPDAYGRELGDEALRLYVARRLATCDANGAAELALGSPISIFGSDSTGSSEVHLLEPGQAELVLVRLPCSSVILRAIDHSTGMPAAGLEFEISQRGAEVGVRCVRETDANGELSASLPQGQFAVRLGERDAATHQTVNELGDRQGYHLIDHVTDREIPVLRVRSQAHLSVRAVDARTDEPIQSFVTWMELMRPSGESDGKSDHIRHDSHEGTYSITHALLRDLPIRLWVHAPGYVAQVVDLTEVGTDPPEEVTVRLEPTSPKTLYLLVAPDDRPYSGRFLARDLSSGRRLFHGENRAGGVILDGWDGGEVQLRANNHGEVIGTLPIEAFTHGDEIVVRVGLLAQVIVEGVPDDAPTIYCELSPRITRVAGVRVGDELHFADLAAGRCVVGPSVLLDGWRQWIQSSSGHGGHGQPGPEVPVYPYELPAKETLRIPWDPAWRHIGSIEGRVVASGVDLADLGVVAIYGPWPKRASVALTPIDAHGRFTLEDLEAEPYAVLVRTRGDDPAGHRGMHHDASTQRNLASGRPGETIYVNCASVEIEFPKSRLGQDAWVNWTLAPDAAPELEQHAAVYLSDISGPTRIPNVPCAARAITVRFRGDADLRRIPVDLVAGETASVRLED